MNRRSRFWVTGTAVATFAIAGALGGSAQAKLIPGTPAKDVHVGSDNDTVAHPLIQPAGVTARQDMDQTDVVFGRGNDDLLVGNRGSDTLVGGPGSDILVGGPDHVSPATAGTPGAGPAGNDVLLGDFGDDIAVWGPGDGNDAFAANEGKDTLIVGSIRTKSDGSLKLESHLGRAVPKVTVDGYASYACTLVAVPDSADLGVQYLLRFSIGGVQQSTIRLKEAERVICPSPVPGTAQVASLVAQPKIGASAEFRTIPLTELTGVAGAIVAAS